MSATKTTPTSRQQLMHVKGKFLYCGHEKFYVKGITYGTFAPDKNDCQFPDFTTIEKDFTMMAIQGINCIRIYTVPPAYLLDIADSLNLKVVYSSIGSFFELGSILSYLSYLYPFLSPAQN